MTVTATPAWTAEAINRALYNHFVGQAWALLFEVTANSDDPFATGRRIDALLVRKARRMGIGKVEMLALEVKVTRGDFLQDVRRPEKQMAWRDTAHRHAYVTPKGLVKPEEVPAGSGLIEVEWHPPMREGGNGRYEVRWTMKVPYSGHREVPSWLISSLAWRMSWAEARLKGYTGVETYDDGKQTIESLRAQLANQTRRADKAVALADREASAKKLWRAMAGAMSGLPCFCCEQMVRPSRLKRSAWGGVVWVHVDPAHEETCMPLRIARDEADAAARSERLGLTHTYQRHPTYVPEPHPQDDDGEDYL